MSVTEKPAYLNQRGYHRMGVVEGFYGRVWSFAERKAFSQKMVQAGANTYLYCPKGELSLGDELLKPFQKADEERLKGVFSLLRKEGLEVWVGLRLVGVGQKLSAEESVLLGMKLEKLSSWGARGFVLQFDDLQTTHKTGLGEFHAKMAQEVCALSPDPSFAWYLVPALYALDPILHKIYGPFEESYLQDLDHHLPAGIGWVYSGKKVCAPTFELEDLEAWNHRSEREVLFWDNYPVNDAAMVNNLHLSPLSGRIKAPPKVMKAYLFNPLLQTHLGMIPGLTALYYAKNPTTYSLEKAFKLALEQTLPQELHVPFMELEALTRRCCLVEFLPEKAFGPEGSLSSQLEKHWPASESMLVEQFSYLLKKLEGGLPVDMKTEAGPWLERLKLACQWMQGKKEESVLQAYQTNKAFVLGAWFQPLL